MNPSRTPFRAESIGWRGGGWRKGNRWLPNLQSPERCGCKERSFRSPQKMGGFARGDVWKVRGGDANCMSGWVEMQRWRCVLYGAFSGGPEKGGLEGEQMRERKEVKWGVKRTKMWRNGPSGSVRAVFSIPSFWVQSASEGLVEGLGGKNVKLAFRTLSAWGGVQVADYKRS